MQDIHTLPCNLGVEQSLLGALIFDNREIIMVSDKLSDASFFGEQHQIIWNALTKLNSEGSSADPNTLLEFFHREDLLKKIGGEQYLAKMVSNAALEPEIPEYAEILIDLQNRRELIRMSQSIEAACVKPEVGQKAGDIAVKASETLSAVMMGSTVKPPVKIIPGIREYVERIRAGKNADDKPFLSSGSGVLDRRLGGGFFPSDLIILAGRPSMGKTMKALNIIEGVASSPSLKAPGKRAHVAFFSLEMDTDKVLGRFMTTNSHKRFGKRYSSLNMRSYDISEEHLDAMGTHAADIGENISIDDDAGITIRDIEIRALNLIRMHGYLDMIVVDYLQIINPPPEDRGNKQAAITNISAGLKRIAKKLDIPVIALSQLSRQVENRDDKRPQLSDLRDSGSIEQDADIVMFAYRHHYYVERSEPADKSNEKHIQWTVELERTRHQFQLIIGKQRIGPVGSDTFWCDTLTGYVGDCDPHDLHGTSIF